MFAPLSWGGLPLVTTKALDAYETKPTNEKSTKTFPQTIQADYRLKKSIDLLELCSSCHCWVYSLGAMCSALSLPKMHCILHTMPLEPSNVAYSKSFSFRYGTPHTVFPVCILFSNGSLRFIVSFIANILHDCWFTCYVWKILTSHYDKVYICLWK